MFLRVFLLVLFGGAKLDSTRFEEYQTKQVSDFQPMAKCGQAGHFLDNQAHTSETSASCGGSKPTSVTYLFWR